MTTKMRDLSILGVTTNEEFIYKTLLSIGIVSAQEISEVTFLKRPTVYLYLEQLKEKGLVSEINSERKKYFQAVNPKYLKQLIRAKRDELESLEKNLPKIVESFGKMQRVKGKSRSYKGVAGLRKIVDELASADEDIYLLGSIKGLHQYLEPNFLDKIYNKPRRRRMNTDYLIADWATSTVKKYFEESGTFTKIRFLPPEIESKGVYVAFGKKLVVVTYNPQPQIVVFEEPVLVELYKMAFNSLWKDLEGKNIPLR